MKPVVAEIEMRDGLPFVSRSRRRRTWTKAAAAFACAFVCLGAEAIEMSNRYRSPRNPERRVRTSTRLIVLHTTEAPARSSLNKVSDRGECHYCVTESGQVYAIVDRDREAFHAGRSMWQGAEDVDKFSVGIECVGYHDKAMPQPQIAAIRDLVRELKAMYRIQDHCVVCHSHVAYGAPNRWHKVKHRGRKRCGMLFAMPSVRRQLGLTSRPAFDPDTRAGRLVNADEYLRRVLYGGVDTMAAVYGARPPPTISAAPRAPAVAKKPVAPAPKPTPKPTPKPASTPKPVSKPAPKASVAVATPPRSVAELKARGYVDCGTVTKERTAIKIAGAAWKSSQTYYTIRDKVIPGSNLDQAHIEKGMHVWMRK